MAIAPKITVVEDEEALSVLLRYNLEAEGYAVETIARGDEAEIALREKVPDLLILDWMLPGTSGIELAAHCSSAKTRPSVRPSQPPFVPKESRFWNTRKPARSPMRTANSC